MGQKGSSPAISTLRRQTWQSQSKLAGWSIRTGKLWCQKEPTSECMANHDKGSHPTWASGLHITHVQAHPHSHTNPGMYKHTPSMPWVPSEWELVTTKTSRCVEGQNFQPIPSLPIGQLPVMLITNSHWLNQSYLHNGSSMKTMNDIFGELLSAGRAQGSGISELHGDRKLVCLWTFWRSPCRFLYPDVCLDICHIIYNTTNSIHCIF